MIIQLFIFGIIAGSQYALIAIGFSLIYKTNRFFHLAHGAVYAVGAYIAYTLSVTYGINQISAFLLAAISTSAFGIAIDRYVYLPLRRSKSPNLVFLIASFGVFIFTENILQLLYGAHLLTIRSTSIKEGFIIGEATITLQQIFIIISSIVLYLIIWFTISKTKIGQAIRAVADDSRGAAVSGIWSERIILYSFAIGSALAGMAGVLVSLETNIDPTMGFNAILKGIIASIIGGIGSIPGALLGGLLLGIVENIGIWNIQACWKDAIAFGILIIFLLLRPQGILGIFNKLDDRI